MKKVFFCVLAFAMPFLVSAQMGFETYSPSYTSDDMVVLQGELDDIEDIDDGASIEIVISYRIEGAPSFTDFSTGLILTNQSSEEIYVTLGGLIPETEYEYFFCGVVVTGAPTITCGDVVSFETDDAGFSTPSVNTSHAEDITSTAVSLVGYVNSFGGYSEATVSYEYGQNPLDPDMETGSIIVKEPNTRFEIDIEGLKPEKVNYFRIKSSNPSGEVIADQEFFNTVSRGVIDVELEDIDQTGTCSIEYTIDADLDELPLPITGEIKVGNPGGTAFYTQEFVYMGDNNMTLTVDYGAIVMAGIDLDDDLTQFNITIEASGEKGKVGGKAIFDGAECEEEFGFMYREAGSPDVMIFPNPATEKVSIKNNEKGFAVISDISGKQINKYDLDAGLTDIMVSHLVTGLYIISFTTGDMTITEKIIKQ